MMVLPSMAGTDGIVGAPAAPTLHESGGLCQILVFDADMKLTARNLGAVEARPPAVDTPIPQEPISSLDDEDTDDIRRIPAVGRRRYGVLNTAGGRSSGGVSAAADAPLSGNADS